MFLLDTHTFLWYIFDDPRLPQNVKDIISNADEVYVSMATLWEIAIKQSIKKLECNCSEPLLTVGRSLHFRQKLQSMLRKH